MKNLIVVGGSGKLGSFCSRRWSQLNYNLLNIDKVESPFFTSSKFIDLTGDHGTHLFATLLDQTKPNAIVVFAGYDFPQTSVNPVRPYSPFDIPMAEFLQAFKLNTAIPHNICRAVYLSNISDLSIVLLSSIYADSIPKLDLYVDEPPYQFKPCAYGMSKRAMEYLLGQVPVAFKGRNVRCNALRMGGINLNIDSDFYNRYSCYSPDLAMVPPETVFDAINFFIDSQTSAINGSILDIDSGMRFV